MQDNLLPIAVLAISNISAVLMNHYRKLKLSELKGITRSYRKFMNLHFESVNNFSNDT